RGDRHHRNGGRSAGQNRADRRLPQSQGPREFCDGVFARAGCGEILNLRRKRVEKASAPDDIGVQGDIAMNAQMQMKPHAILERDITPEGGDYEIVLQVIEKISLDYRDQPSLETLA